MRTLSATLQTTYANLVQMHVNRPSFDFEGAPFTMVRKGRTYWYANQRSPDGKPRQRYLGPDTAEMRARVDAMRGQQQNLAEFRKHASGLVAQLHAGGVVGPDRDTGPILRALMNSGVFRLGGTLVGTHAFRHYDLELGVLLADATGWVTQTDDIDIASFEHLSMAIGDTADPDLAAALVKLGFKPANSLNPKTPTTWAMASSKYAIDFLTPSFDERQAPTRLAALNMWAQSLHYLNFLIADPIPAVSPYMEGLLVQIPRPERYAVHKLIVSQKRNAASGTKKQKDVEQARVLIEALSETRPYQLQEAVTDASARGLAWREALDQALAITFKAPPMQHDFDRDVVWFEGTALGAPHRCEISGEALEDHFGAGGSAEERLKAARASRSKIETLLRNKFRATPSPQTLITTTEIVV